eukprot:TRINITY_DN71181_c0_g1_i1.p1 TRINITY_DN71181_c0_g1~~TRINITY_DN71181_c0_g1_i1.p1  ORF type:complete len:634 (+),score=154.41 TRINITY_DN71181_c0_g1_i1:106-1902(+)
MTAWQVATAQRYGELLQKLHHPWTDGISAFQRQWLALSQVDQQLAASDQCCVALHPAHQHKNRPGSVLPNDTTRFVLSPQSDRLPDNSTYINASCVEGATLFRLPFNYIATQAPMDHTVCDFWRMVAEAGSCYIISLTAATEPYWGEPGVETSLPGTPYAITLTGETQHADVVVRTFELSDGSGATRPITQFQLLNWPEGGLPPDASSLMWISLQMGSNAAVLHRPIVVHCTDGATRTGVFIGFHVTLALFNLEQMPPRVPRPGEYVGSVIPGDAWKCVWRVVQLLKYQRRCMVGTPEQYQFLLKGLLDAMVYLLSPQRREAELSQAGMSQGAPFGAAGQPLAAGGYAHPGMAQVVPHTTGVSQIVPHAAAGSPGSPVPATTVVAGYPAVGVDGHPGSYAPWHQHPVPPMTDPRQMPLMRLPPEGQRSPPDVEPPLSPQSPQDQQRLLSDAALNRLRAATVPVGAHGGVAQPPALQPQYSRATSPPQGQSPASQYEAPQQQSVAPRPSALRTSAPAGGLQNRDGVSPQRSPRSPRVTLSPNIETTTVTRCVGGQTTRACTVTHEGRSTHAVTDPTGRTNVYASVEEVPAQYRRLVPAA